MRDKDVRWIQRLKNFSKALSQLTKFIDKASKHESSFRLESVDHPKNPSRLGQTPTGEKGHSL